MHLLLLGIIIYYHANYVLLHKEDVFSFNGAHTQLENVCAKLI